METEEVAFSQLVDGRKEGNDQDQHSQQEARDSPCFDGRAPLEPASERAHSQQVGARKDQQADDYARVSVPVGPRDVYSLQVRTYFNQRSEVNSRRRKVASAPNN